MAMSDVTLTPFRWITVDTNCCFHGYLNGAVQASRLILAFMHVPIRLQSTCVGCTLRGTIRLVTHYMELILTIFFMVGKSFWGLLYKCCTFSCRFGKCISTSLFPFTPVKRAKSCYRCVKWSSDYKTNLLFFFLKKAIISLKCLQVHIKGWVQVSFSSIHWDDAMFWYLKFILLELFSICTVP